MLYCEECGHEVDPDSCFCENCGTRLSIPSTVAGKGLCAVSVIRNGRAVAFLSETGGTMFIKEFPAGYCVVSARIEGDRVVVESERKSRRVVFYLNKTNGGIMFKREL